ncbi:MAG: hypothetical protein Q4E57_05000 [Eubacteriales bacterium]|nr:hypothetical protein [Eubacteriales bacterium]
MKKILALIAAFAMAAMLLCIPAFAAADAGVTDKDFTIKEYIFEKDTKDLTYFCVLTNNSKKNIKTKVDISVKDASGKELKADSITFNTLAPGDTAFQLRSISAEGYKKVDSKRTYSEEKRDEPVLKDIKLETVDLKDHVVVTLENNSEYCFSDMSLAAIFLDKQDKVVAYDNISVQDINTYFNPGQKLSLQLNSKEKYDKVVVATTAPGFLKKPEKIDQPLTKIDPEKIELKQIYTQDKFGNAELYYTVTNKNDDPAIVNINAVAYDKDGKIIASADSYYNSGTKYNFYAIGKDKPQLSCLIFNNVKSEDIDKIDYQIEAHGFTEKYKYVSIENDFEYNCAPDGKNLKGKATNKSKDADLSGSLYVFFVDKDGKLLEKDSSTIGSKSLSLKAGETKEFDISLPRADYDHYDIYYRVSGKVK